MESTLLNQSIGRHYNAGLAERMQCSTDEKLACVDTLNFILELSTQARKHGLLYLENYIEKAGLPLLRKAITYVIDGIEPDMIAKILTTYMIAENLKGRELLEGMLILDGMLSIQAGVHTLMLREILSAYFGTGLQLRLVENFESGDRDKVEDFIHTVEAKAPLDPRTAILEEFDGKMDDRSFQRLLREIDTTDLMLALYGASGKFQKRVLLNVSRKLAQMLVDELENIPKIEIDDIALSQKKILEVVSKLVEEGDILLK